MPKTTKNPLHALEKLGVAVWSDYIRRGWLLDGSLRRLVSEDGLRGLTSNPTIFDKAISGSADYDHTLEALAGKDHPALEVFERLSTEDIRIAADLLRPVFDRTSGQDGFVSIEVYPHLAADTDATVDTARRLWRTVSRPNVMIKVPGTKEGLPAITTLIGEGINVNVTLLFARERYLEVIEAYLAGLEKLERSGRPLAGVASVASFFVSRVDSAVDGQLAERAKTAAPAEKKALKALLGKAAIANAKLAYRDFQKAFASERFKRLKEKGAKVQRLLWASTSTKNPDYRDVIYVEELIGPDTVNTMPLATIDAFRDHGRAVPTLTKDVAKAERQLEELEALGIRMRDVTARLEVDGVKAFADSFDSVLKSIAAKRETLRAAQAGRPGWKETHETRLAELEAANFPKRLWEQDTTLWSQDPRHQKIISNRLGWLGSPEWALERVAELEAFAADCRKAGFRHCVLLGMGGSSLAPEVYRKTFGVKKGFLDLIVLDTTDPRQIAECEKRIDLKRALFLVSSKSGGTIEVQSLFKYFHARLAAKVKKPGAHFAAVTDPDTVLGQQAKDFKFRRCFVNPADIGGRYSALSYFGLVPAALLGVDLKAVLRSALLMADRCRPAVPARDNPGLDLGAWLAALQSEGKDKATLVSSPQIRAFGDWAEQLIAESTGKEGTEVLPVVGEGPVPFESYGPDRAFVFLVLEGDKATLKRAQELEKAGRPVKRLVLKDAADLGGEYYRWMVATVVAGALLGIDAFDEPNVQESKDNTAALLKEFESAGRLPEERASLQEDGLKVYGAEKGDTLAAALSAHLARLKPGDFIGLMAYLPKNAANEKQMDALRAVLRDATKAAVTVGFGPRFLHSTGQLHKGGKNNGLFLQVTVDEPKDLAIPGSKWGFATLKAAQALGDLGALRHKARPVLRVHLQDPAKGLKYLRTAVDSAVKAAAGKGGR